MTTRKAAVAGMFYPADRKELDKTIIGLLKECQTPEKAENGIIVPHAGYVYSGKTAAYAYNSFLNVLKEKQFSKIIILGPAHQISFDRVFQDQNKSWETPLGKIELAKFKELKESGKSHLKEHSVEVQVPFVQKVLELAKKKIPIMPMVVGELDEEKAKKYAEFFSKQDNCFFIISTDLSHFMPKNEAEMVDRQTVQEIMNKNYGSIDACGRYPLMIAVEMAKIKNWQFRLLKYSTSAEASGDESSVVGYASFIF
ncbi:AmmeMemoRadiSam system protein B [Candidatus Woesearchaeota archaeon]|nr:AmmeMemoRadiSam system protein B [Candidatus Woesearchaeota archaeon]